MALGIADESPKPPAVSNTWEWSCGRFAFALAAFLVVSFPSVLLGRQSFFYRDYGVLAYPAVFFHRESFWRGEIPFWNPYTNCGVPFLAQWGTMALYPFSLFYLVLPIPWALNFFCLAHLFLAGLGMRQLVFSWTGKPFAAAVAGTVFVFNGVTFSSLLWPNYCVALGWMPWVIWSVERAVRRGGLATALAVTLATLQMLAGVPEIVLLTWVALAGIWARLVWLADPPRRTCALRLGIILAFVSGLVAVQLLPFLQLLHASQRTANFATAKWAMPLSGLANLIFPLFRSFLTPQGVYFQIGQEFFSSTYLGIGAVAAALLAVQGHRPARLKYLIVLCVFCLVLALGDNGFIYSWLRKAFPVLGVARYPIKFLILPAFLFPIFAAYGLSWVQECESQERFRRVLSRSYAALILGLGGLLVYSWRRPLPADPWPAIWKNSSVRAVFLTLFIGGLYSWKTRLARASTNSGTQDHRLQVFVEVGLLGLLAADILTHVPLQNPTLPTDALAPGLWPLTQKISAPELGEGRAFITPRAEESLLMSPVADRHRDFLGKRLALWSNLNLLDSIAKVNGSATLVTAREKQIENLLYGTNNLPATNLLNFLGVTVQTAPRTIVEWSSRGGARPIVTAGQAPLFRSDEEILRALSSADFNPAQQVYLSLKDQHEVAAKATETKITRLRFRPNRIEFEIEAAGPSIAVVAQSFYPSWRAKVDLKSVPIWPANHAFQAIEVPPGKHRVTLTYHDSAWIAGAWISGLSALFGTALLIWQARRSVVSRVS